MELIIIVVVKHQVICMHESKGVELLLLIWFLGKAPTQAVVRTRLP